MEQNPQPVELRSNFVGATLVVARAGSASCPDNGTGQARPLRQHVPDLRIERDALIAATANVHGMTVVTGNVVHFETKGAEVTDPWAKHGTDALR